MNRLAALQTDPRIVLVVEDDLDVQRILVRALEFSGFWAIPTSSGVEAVNVFPAYARAIDVALIAQYMPRLDGVGTMQALHRIKPTLRCCLMGGTVFLDRKDFLAAGAASVLSKPFRLEALAECVFKLTKVVPSGSDIYLPAEPHLRSPSSLTAGQVGLRNSQQTALKTKNAWAH